MTAVKTHQTEADYPHEPPAERPRRRRALIIGAVLLGIVAIGWGLWTLLAPEPPASEPVAATRQDAGVRVSTVVAGPKVMARRLRVTGTLVARDEVSIGTALQDQRIAAVLVDEGESVVAGQVLARLETDNLQAQLRQTQAAVTRASAAIEQAEAVNAEAQASLQRILPLGQSGAVSAQQVDERRAQAGSAAGALAVARAELTQTQAQLADARTQLAKAEIRAPVAGIVSERTARLGALAGGPDPLFRLIRNGLIELDGEVAESDLSIVRPGSVVSVEVPGVAAPIIGRVRMVAPKVDPQTRLGRVRVSLPVSPDVRAGAYARGVILIDEDSIAVTVPQSAVTTNAAGASVMVVDAQGRAARRPVSIGRTADGVVEVRTGLREGERVVAQASAFVREGDRVQLAGTPPAAVREAGR